jgi:2-polyprenyl-3-methyl-5-hydroxy-6-metoxy-1,4-benzoquinol methylase
MDEESHVAPGAQAPDATHRYERAIDPDSPTTHGRVVQLVGRDRRVLELGPATGHMTATLRERGCTVVGIEFDATMAAEGERFTERMIVGDLDTLDLTRELGEDRFDVIVAADVLEHLRDPLTLLRRLREFLNPGGYFVISLPNIAHGSVRLALLEGRFHYQETGLLDRTHLRFFTRANIEEMLDAAGLAMADLYRQTLPVDASEIEFDPAAIPADVRELVAADPEAETYQFVLKAISLATEGMPEVQRRMREMAAEIADMRVQLERMRLPEEQMRRLGELRGSLINAHDQLLRRDEENERLRRELGDLRESEIGLRVRLERILASPPARAYAALSTMPGLGLIKNARAASHESAMQRARDARPHG